VELIPSIDLRAGRVVRLEQGDYARETTYDADPVELARSFAGSAS
jgi:phosphoribosylformimino-5-aminoimidazole carboxamide ribotide isomerase